jgi:DNA-binding response OmpR family regulator
MSVWQGLLRKLGLGDAAEGRAPLRVFILDDEQERHDWLAARFKRDHIDSAFDPARAVELLAANRYDAIFLDHDLLPEHYKNQQEPDDERTGYKVASWLAANAGRNSVARIIVHTRNADGAWRMVSLMRDAGLTAEHVPFPYLSQKIKTYWRR